MAEASVWAHHTHTMQTITLSLTWLKRRKIKCGRAFRIYLEETFEIKTIEDIVVSCSHARVRFGKPLITYSSVYINVR